MQGKTFQLIFDEVSQFLPQDWKKIIIYLEYGEGSYAYSFYVKNKSKFVNGLSLPNIDEKQVGNAFSKIDKVILKERMLSKDALWTNMTMIVDSEGSMHTDYDYTDLSEGAYSYKKQWKEKYLK